MNTSPKHAVRPTLREAFASSQAVLAYGFGTGAAKYAPGTWGSLLAWALYVLLLQQQSFSLQLAWIGAAFALGVWVCGAVAKSVGVADPSSIVWDEIVAVWLVLAWLPPDVWTQAAAVALFRFFDIVKPPPIRQADAYFKGGFGIMLDDVLAAFFTLLVLALWTRLF